MARMLLSLVLCVTLMVSLAAGGGNKGGGGGKKGGGYTYVAPQKVIILQAGPSVTYPWAGFCGPKGKCKKIPKLTRPPFPSLLPPAPPLQAYVVAAPPAYTPPVAYAPQPAYTPPAPAPYYPPQEQPAYAPQPTAYSQPAPQVVQHAPEVHHHAPEVHHHAPPPPPPPAPAPQEFVAPAGAGDYVAPQYAQQEVAAIPTYQADSPPPLSSYQVAPVPTFDTPEPRPASFNTESVSSNSWGDAPVQQESSELSGGYANSAPVTVPPVYEDVAVQQDGPQTWDAPPALFGEPSEQQQYVGQQQQDVPQESNSWVDQPVGWESNSAGPAQEIGSYQDDFAQPSEAQQYSNVPQLTGGDLGPAVEEFHDESFAQDFLPAVPEESIQQEYAPADGFGTRIRPRGNLQDRQF